MHRMTMLFGVIGCVLGCRDDAPQGPLRFDLSNGDALAEVGVQHLAGKSGSHFVIGEYDCVVKFREGREFRRRVSRASVLNIDDSAVGIRLFLGNQTLDEAVLSAKELYREFGRDTDKIEEWYRSARLNQGGIPPFSFGLRFAPDASIHTHVDIIHTYNNDAPWGVLVSFSFAGPDDNQ